MRRTMTTLALGLALAACSRGDKPPAPATPRAAVSRTDAIVALLQRGDAKDARKAIRRGLAAAPMDPELLLLRDSIDRDPKELLGPQSYSYEVQAGESMLVIADRLLGNRLKFYQLARYNGIANPATLAAGTTLRIPGTPPRPAAPVPAARPAPRPASPSPRERAEAPPVRPATRPAAPPAANPVAARAARAAGLAALNQGNVSRAVALLRRAVALEPGNPVLAHDLQRAERIRATVRARR